MGFRATCSSQIVSFRFWPCAAGQLNGKNPYDVRTPCEERGICYDFSAVEEYLRSDAVMQELGTVGHRWKECNYRMYVRGVARAGEGTRALCLPLICGPSKRPSRPLATSASSWSAATG